MRMAWLLLALSLQSAVVAVEGAGIEGDTNAIRIGVSCVLSGPSSALGSNLCAGSRAWFDRINAAGGIHGRPVRMILRDDQYEPEPAVLNTSTLVKDDRVLFLFNYVGTPTLTRVLPLLGLFRDESLVMVGPFTGAAPQRRPPYDRFVFNIRASYQDETRILVDHLISKGHRRIGFLGQADAYGKSGETGVTQALGEHGLSPVCVVTYRRNQAPETSMAEQVELLRSAGADAVICVGVYQPCAAFIAECRARGWMAPIANVSFVGSNSLLEQLRQLSTAAGQDLTVNLINSQVVPPTNDPTNPLVREFNAAMGHPTDPQPVAFEGWLNAAVVTEALRRAGPDPTRQRFINAMESLEGWDPGIGTPLRFSPTNHIGLSTVWLEKTANGHWVPVRQEVSRR